MHAIDDNKKMLYAALSAGQFALFNLIPTSLRAVGVICENHYINYLFYCNEHLSEQEREIIMIDIVGEISDHIENDLLHFFGPLSTIRIIPEIIQLNSSTPIPQNVYVAFKAYEPGVLNNKNILFPANFIDDLTALYKHPLRSSILMAAQKSLLNRVENNLTDVDVAWDKKYIILNFYYEDQITDSNHQLAQTAKDEFISYFPNHILDFKILPSTDAKKFLDFYNILPRENISAVFSR